MKPFRLTQQQQQRFGHLLNVELEKVTMSWDGELRRWHETAIAALLFARPFELQVPQEGFLKLVEVEKTGVNMGTVMRLCNNIEMRTAFEMNHTFKEWAEFLLLNSKVAARWNVLAEPCRQKIYKLFEEENNKARIMTGIQGGMKLVKGEA